jgi:hypothetical protein
MSLNEHIDHDLGHERRNQAAGGRRRKPVGIGKPHMQGEKCHLNAGAHHTEDESHENGTAVDKGGRRVATSAMLRDPVMI